MKDNGRMVAAATGESASLHSVYDTRVGISRYYLGTRNLQIFSLKERLCRHRLGIKSRKCKSAIFLIGILFGVDRTRAEPVSNSYLRMDSHSQAGSANLVLKN